MLEWLLAALALFAAMLALMELGSRAGKQRLTRDPENARAGTAAAEGAVFGLLGLLIAFTFSSAAQRFDTRRQLIVAEVNAIGTGWLRLDLFPEVERAELRQGFRDYLDARLEVYRAVPDLAAIQRALEKAAERQNELWKLAVAACARTGASQHAMLLLPALNEMFDLAAERTAASEMHTSPLVYGLLILLALGCALLAGFAMAAASVPSWTHRIAFAAIIALTTYTIFDLEHPRLGLVRVDTHDNLMVELHESLR